jgi:tellurite methyltransferase
MWMSQTIRVDQTDAARRETIRYHQELYRSTPLGLAGTWLAGPHRLVTDAIAMTHDPVHAYDLGAGVGRHTIPLARDLPPGSQVTAVELLPSALDHLRRNAAESGVAERIDTVIADLEDYEFPAADAGLIVAFSSIEHVTSMAALTRLLQRCRHATTPGGVNALGVFAERKEVHDAGVRQALIELPLTRAQTRTLLGQTYIGWDVLLDEYKPTRVWETREGEPYQLQADLVSFVALKGRCPTG